MERAPLLEDSRMDISKQHVIAYCQQKGYELIMPSKADRTILVFEGNGNTVGKCLAEGRKWADVASQLGRLRA
jgi:hypothetical protein